MLNKNSHIVFPYNKDNLAIALSNAFMSPEQIEKTKWMSFNYFLDYFDKEKGLNAKTIVVEYNYISTSYLHDFATYYSLCFNNYEKFCKRVHFFDFEFSPKQFNSAILNNKSKYNKIWDHYLGYIVVKPLPKTIIGPTLLKTFSSNEKKIRHFAVKPYKINLFGKQVIIETLAYQEQDTVVSACATTSLWSAFHKTSYDFNTHIPTPSEITSSAGNLFENSGRTFPNHGLDLYQIGNAIESIGLVSELRNQKTVLSDINYIKSFIYAHNRAGFPVMLGINLEGDGHLITITGYREPAIVNSSNSTIPTFFSHSIERFYAHDDQIGPFSRIGFEGANIITGWPNDKSFTSLKKAEIICIIVPIYHKIRITYEEIYSKVNPINLFISKSTNKNFHWNIYLQYSNVYKENVRKKGKEFNLIKRKIQFMNLPKYIWIAKLFIEGTLSLEMVFDATDIESGFYCLALNIYDVETKNFLSPVIKFKNVEEYFLANLGLKYLDLFRNELA